MKTVNISLTEDQSKFVDQAVIKLGFANRSEFFRSLVRLFVKKPDLAQEIDFPMRSPNTRSAKKVLESFRQTGKYSSEFLSDLEEGLRDSQYFVNDLPKADE